MSDGPRTETLSVGRFCPDRAPVPPGTQIGRRYKIRRVLGSGGSAVVYSAWDRELRRDIALEVLRHDRLSEPMLKRFRREVAVARDAESPRIVKVNGELYGNTAGTTPDLRANIRWGGLQLDDDVKFLEGCHYNMDGSGRPLAVIRSSPRS